MTDEMSKGKTEQMLASDTPIIEIKKSDFSQRLILNNTVYLTDVVPIEQLLHAADRIIGNDSLRGPVNEWGYRNYSIETMNAVELIRKAMSDIIDELHARIVPTNQG